MKKRPAVVDATAGRFYFCVRGSKAEITGRLVRCAETGNTPPVLHSGCDVIAS